MKPDDPYAREPKRVSGLKIIKHKPFNAESPVILAPDHYITPSQLYYVRHHHPVPDLDPSTFRLSINVDNDDDVDRTVNFKLDELKKWFPKTKVVATMQCGGNRRHDFNRVAKTQGFAWDNGAISTAEWGGVLVRDIFAKMDIHSAEEAKAKGIQYVCVCCVCGVFLLVVLRGVFALVMCNSAQGARGSSLS